MNIGKVFVLNWIGDVLDHIIMYIMTNFSEPDLYSFYIISQKYCFSAWPVPLKGDCMLIVGIGVSICL